MEVTYKIVNYLQESIESREAEDQLDVITDSKLHVIFGGTKVVQHTPPVKGSVMRGINYFSNNSVC